MTDKPILFSTPMSEAILAGRKTQTRRIFKAGQFCEGPETGFRPLDVRRWAVGDRLWVREACYIYGFWVRDGLSSKGRQKWRFREWHPRGVCFDPQHQPSNKEALGFWRRNSIHMPRWASRLTLRVTDVRVERLHDISRADALAEGVEFESADPPFYYVAGIYPHSLTGVGVEEPGGRHAERSYAKLWNYINGPGAWEENPRVVALTFTKECQPNGG